MIDDDELFKLAQLVSYANARRYVLSRGWQDSPSRRSDLGIFRWQGHEAVLPMDPQLGDYATAMLQFARKVAAAESRGAEMVLRDLLAPDVDRHRPARIGPSDASIEVAAWMLDGLGRALRAAACSTLQPSPFHPRMSRSEADAFVGASRFTNTEVGSFVVVIETPLEVEAAPPQFGRAVSVTLMRSLEHVARCLRRAQASRIVNPEPGEPRVSANLCESILRMAPPSELADLRFDISWSSLLDVPTDAPARVSIDRSMYEALEQVAGELRPSQPSVHREHLGFVKELKGSMGPTGAPEGEVVFTIVVEDGAEVRAKAVLDSAQYQVAWKAHGGAVPVEIEGELHRVRRGYELRAVTSLKLWRGGDAEH